MRICVLIPAYNEEKTISSLIASIRDKGLDVIVINDGSTDRTGIVAMERGAYVIHHPAKQGKGSSLIEGFQYILIRGYDGVITMDGDGQHDPSDIDGFLEALKASPAEILVGNRMSDTREMPLIRRLTNRFMSWLISCACHQPIADTQCGFRYVSARALKAIELNTTGFEIETEMLMKASRQKMPIASVAVKTIYRNEESKIHPVKDTVRFVRYFLKALWEK